MDILQKAYRLKLEANKVLSELDLIDTLQKVGEPNLVGSIVLDLMVYKDIDIEVIVDPLNRKSISQVISNLASKDSRRIDFSVINNTSDIKLKFPEGVYLGIKYHLGLDWISNFSGNENTWKIDIWFVKKENARSLKTTEMIKSQLTEQNKKIILEIKNSLYKEEGYRKVFTALDIYKAVLEERVGSVTEFNKHLGSR